MNGKQPGDYAEDYVVFDLETTGISTMRDAIIEISALRVRKGVIEGEYSTLVDPGRPIPPGATAVNGITDAMVAGAPKLAEAMEGFLEFIERDILVGHNIHSFDMVFIRNAAKSALGKEITNDYIDTLPMARRILPGLRHHKLTDVSQYFHIATEGAHRAFNDCVMNQRCYEAMRELAREKEQMLSGRKETPDTLACPLCGNVLVKRNGRFGEFYGCAGFPRCRYTQNL